MESNWKALAHAPVTILKGTSALKVTSLNWDLAKGGWGLEFIGHQTFHLWLMSRVRRIRALRRSTKLLLFKSLFLMKSYGIFAWHHQQWGYTLKACFCKLWVVFSTQLLSTSLPVCLLWYELECKDWKNSISMKVLSYLVFVLLLFLYHFLLDDSIAQCN